jgi:hypothetical protein
VFRRIAVRPGDNRRISLALAAHGGTSCQHNFGSDEQIFGEE